MCTLDITRLVKYLQTISTLLRTGCNCVENGVLNFYTLYSFMRFDCTFCTGFVIYSPIPTFPQLVFFSCVTQD